MSRWENFTIPEPEKKVLKVPALRATRRSPKLEFPVPNKWGFGLKIALRQVAKKFPEYHLPVTNEFLPLKTSEGVEVNTLGRWAWGVPGYMGHLVFEGGVKDKIVIYYPEGSPPELITLLQKAVSHLK